jgi:hypothetical protein
VQRKGGECTRIDERDARSILKLECGAREGRFFLAYPTDVPVARHPEVYVNDRAIVEVQELVLPAPLYSP